MNPIKQLLTATAEKAGYFLLPRWRIRKYELARLLAQLFQRLEVSCVLDVGANVGQYGRFLRDEVGYRGRIVSFEPLPQAFAELQKIAARRPPWQTHPLALGASPRTMPLNVMAATEFNSFLSPVSTGIDHVEEKNRVREVIEVRVERLDSIVPDDQNLFLKMDTQGYDLEVLSGATGCLDRVRGMQSEVSVIPIYDRMPDMHTSLAEFSRRGFDLAGLFPVSRDESLRVIEFDAVLVNRQAIQRRTLPVAA
jgi:FkbM family methyltransferase